MDNQRKQAVKLKSYTWGNKWADTSPAVWGSEGNETSHYPYKGNTKSDYILQLEAILIPLY